MAREARRCPPCGAANGCALAAGAAVADCWCATVVVSAAALRRLPVAARGAACLCPACATGGNGMPGQRGEALAAAEGGEAGGPVVEDGLFDQGSTGLRTARRGGASPCR